MACMSSFAKKLQDDGAICSRGDVRQRYLESYLVHQMREQEASSEIVSSHTSSLKHNLHQDVHWWSKEKMNLEIGGEKAEHWRQSGLIPSQPDSVTGSNEENHKEWGVPQNWARMTMADMRSLALTVSTNADEKDIELVKQSASLIAPNDEDHKGIEETTEATPKIKIEPVDEEDEEKKKVSKI